MRQHYPQTRDGNKTQCAVSAGRGSLPLQPPCVCAISDRPPSPKWVRPDQGGVMARRSWDIPVSGVSNRPPFSNLSDSARLACELTMMWDRSCDPLTQKCCADTVCGRHWSGDNNESSGRRLSGQLIVEEQITDQVSVLGPATPALHHQGLPTGPPTAQSCPALDHEPNPTPRSGDRHMYPIHVLGITYLDTKTTGASHGSNKLSRSEAKAKLL